MSCLLKRLPWRQMSLAHWRWRPLSTVGALPKLGELRIRMDRRLSLRHENPIFALYVSRQTDAGHCRQPQRAIGVPAIDVVLDLAAHRTTITTGPIPAIA